MSSIFGQSFSKSRDIDVIENKHYKIAIAKEQILLENYAKVQVGVDIRIENIRFNYNGRDTFMHTMISGENNKTSLVLIHGYLATSLFYYKTIQKFSSQYKVYSIDLLGMGLSDRQKFDFQKPLNHHSAIQFFVESFEEWRKAVGIESFILAGHSFGGFISFNYFLQHQDRVEQLYLLSPMSASKTSPEEDLRDDDVFQQYVSSLKFKVSLFPKFMRYMHKKKATLSSFLKSWYIPSNYFINKIVDQRFTFDTDEEREHWKQYFKAVQFLPESTDHLIHEFVSIPYVQPKISIEEICEQNQLLQQKIPIHFIYGDYDWMDHSGTVRLLRTKTIKGTLRFIQNSGHLIPFEQPNKLVKLMIEQIQYHEKIQSINKSTLQQNQC